MSNEYDIVIIGMGAVGLSTALALAQQGWNIALIGELDLRRQGRTIALFEGSSLPLLRRLINWEALAPKGAPLKTIRLIDQTDTLFPTPQLDFHAHEIALSAFGWNIETHDLVAHLWATCEKQDNIHVYKDRFQSLTSQENEIEIRFASDACVHTKLLIAADGAQSPVRHALGLASTRKAHEQVALTAIFTHSRPHQNVSTEFHTRAGPCTLVPLPDTENGAHRSSLVWVLTPTEAAQLRELPADELTHHLEKYIHYILGEMTCEGEIAGFPLSSLDVPHITANRVALIGDAAHGLPPIGAQGLNLGLRDVADLSDILSNAREQDPGASELLQRYQRQRKPDINGRHLLVNWLNNLPRFTNMGADFARALGMSSLALCAPLRKTLMKEGIR